MGNNQNMGMNPFDDQRSTLGNNSSIFANQRLMTEYPQQRSMDIIHPLQQRSSNGFDSVGTNSSMISNQAAGFSQQQPVDIMQPFQQRSSHDVDSMRNNPSMVMSRTSVERHPQNPLTEARREEIHEGDRSGGKGPVLNLVS